MVMYWSNDLKEVLINRRIENPKLRNVLKPVMHERFKNFFADDVCGVMKFVSQENLIITHTLTCVMCLYN